ncbi:MAG TPA: 2,3-bisphosphoglycerate-independent phosphoglycerate mutase [Gemmatimonadales bacterium]|nr:2,3-bisphosphoglycerate-independent phosphoglycerate mutase [Gemmatimonadales bacterium]
MAKPRGQRTPVVLIVLDGWGFRPSREGNAIELGRTPVWHRLWERFPRTLLEASGLAVGLPEGLMGNSEVGHMNLGAGRVVPQDIVRISQSIDSGEFFRLAPLVELCRNLKKSGGTLHLMGLIGTGGVHALDKHLLAAVKLGLQHGIPVAIHAWLDGRDTPPKSGLAFVQELLSNLGRDGPEISTIVGRYYPMDRDKRWDRTKLAYDAMVHGVGSLVPDPVSAVRQAYEAGETDEFIKPRVISGAPRIKTGDGVFCVNFRADRVRQIVRALADPAFTGFDMGTRPQVTVVTMTRYDQTLPLPAAFAPFSMARIVAEVVSECGMTMFRTAETEKYAHVTYFFNGGVEPPFPGEERLLVPSQQVATYDLMPEMSAPGVTDVLCKAIEGREHDFILCNYANGDMVGHSGVLSATIKAVETVDQCLKRVLESAGRAPGTRLLITADHGNCELMIDPVTGGPHTAHTTNPVPFVIVDDGFKGPLRQGGALRDVGPTILGLLGVEQPAEMTGQDLRETE